MAAAMDLCIDLGPMPVDAHAGLLMEGLRGLWEKSELCDVELIAGGQTFLAHRPVLAAVSPSFRECLMRLSTVQDVSADAKKTLTLKLGDITHPEAVQAMLNCIYGPLTAPNVPTTYSPTNEEANRDVLRLAQRFQITQLQAEASRWLTSNLSTANVLQRLVACEEFGLADVRDKILDQITANPTALYVLAKDPEMVKAPSVLQELLVRVLKLLGCDSANPPAPPPAAAAPAPAAPAKPAAQPKAAGRPKKSAAS